jgi:hypothetical protein
MQGDALQANGLLVLLLPQCYKEQKVTKMSIDYIE